MIIRVWFWSDAAHTQTTAISTSLTSYISNAWSCAYKTWRSQKVKKKKIMMGLALCLIFLCTVTHTHTHTYIWTYMWHNSSASDWAVNWQQFSDDLRALQSRADINKRLNLLLSAVHSGLWVTNRRMALFLFDDVISQVHVNISILFNGQYTSTSSCC